MKLTKLGIMSRNSEALSDQQRKLSEIVSDDGRLESSSGGDQPTPDYNNSDAINADNFFSRNLLLSELWGGHKSCVTYENLCTGCGYGVFEAKGKLCNFCQFVVSGCFEEDNIYENICVKCGEIFSGKECELCSPSKVVKKSKKSTRILSGIFETLKRVKSRDKNTKPRKLEIVHNVDGYNNVFKTNETFDLNRICELKRLQSSSDHHIYGKLRKSDDHLMTSFESPTRSLTVNSKSDPTLHKIVKSHTSASSSASRVNKRSGSDKKTYTFFEDSVIEWMTSLRSQTFDYNSVPDDSICNTKSIPSRNFSCCDFVNVVGSSEFLSGEETTLRSLFTSDQDCTQMVDDFKRNLMEKQRSKRRAIYLKVDEPETTSDTTSFDSITGTLRRSRRRYGFYEKDSDFVNDLLSAFDAFLSRDRDHDDLNAEIVADSAIVVSENPQQIVQKPALIECGKHPRLDVNANQNGAIKCLVSNSDFLAKQIDLKSIIATLTVSSSLNRVVVTYDKHLSAFLKVINTQEFVSCEFSKLVKIFSKINSSIILKVNKKDKRANKSDRAITYESASMTVQPKEEDIYQPIWKFKTVGNPRESYASDYYDITPYDSSRVEDYGEWETDDEFMFSTKMKEVTIDDDDEISSKISTNDTQSENSMCMRNDPYQSVCIFYSPTEPKLRAIVYNYDRRCSYFTSQSYISSRSGCDRDVRLPEPLQVPLKVTIRQSRESVRNASIPDCVQAWKFMLLDINYMEDEEDMYVSEDEILKLKQIESESVPAVSLQRFKSVSSDNLLDIPQDKKSIGERFRNKLQRGVLKLNSRQPKDKKGKQNFKRSDSTSLYLEDGIKPKYPIFGAPLHEVEMDSVECTVPRFVADCISYIEQKEFIQIDGLYRASGNKVAIDDLKKKLTESYIYDSRQLKNEDVHTITGLLKLFFRELKTPLIPQELYRKLPENLVESSNLPAIKKTLLEIPNPSLGTLKFILKHLTVVAHYSTENRMPASNLAIIWGPCILYSSSMGPFEIARMNTLTKVLIENYDAIFGDNERLVN